MIDYKVMVFYMQKPENIICDGILHVNMFHYFKIPCFTCTVFTKFIYNEYIGPYVLSHVVFKISPVISPRLPFYTKLEDPQIPKLDLTYVFQATAFA
jgi:hypothetical protein